MKQLRTTRMQNGYQFVDGVAMHAELSERFQIPPPTVKKNVRAGHFVEVRIDSPRFSAHPDAPELCECPDCKEPMTKPVLCHQEPASFVEIPQQSVPSRGWGEQFWVRVSARRGKFVQGQVDNVLYESRLHGLSLGDQIVFLEDHILAVHASHNEEIIRSMDETDLAEFRQWLQERWK